MNFIALWSRPQMPVILVLGQSQNQYIALQSCDFQMNLYTLLHDILSKKQYR